MKECEALRSRLAQTERAHKEVSEVADSQRRTIRYEQQRRTELEKQTPPSAQGSEDTAEGARHRNDRNGLGCASARRAVGRRESATPNAPRCSGARTGADLEPNPADDVAGTVPRPRGLGGLRPDERSTDREENRKS